VTGAGPAAMPWHGWGLPHGRRVAAGLARARAAGVVDPAPNGWQLVLGVVRMWHRIAFRSETVGTCPGGAVRPTARARLFRYRAARLPALLALGAVVPLDLTGLASSRASLIRHLLGAHHFANQMVYDLEILAMHDGGLDALARELDEVLRGASRRARLLRDVAVFDGYHEQLHAALAAFRAAGPAYSPDEAADPDISFAAYLRWCARQPATPAATLRALAAGRFRLPSGLAPATEPAPGEPAAREAAC
jgi:hypothetical protein